MGTVHRQTSNKTKLKGKAMKISEWVSTGHPDKLAIEDWKNTQPAGC